MAASFAGNQALVLRGRGRSQLVRQGSPVAAPWPGRTRQAWQVVELFLHRLAQESRGRSCHTAQRLHLQAPALRAMQHHKGQRPRHQALESMVMHYHEGQKLRSLQELKEALFPPSAHLELQAV